MQFFYDRGTLVLSGLNDQAIDLPQGFIWDSRVQSYRAPALLYHQIRKELKTNQIQFDDLVHSNRPDVGREGNSGKWRTTQLRPYQETAIDLWEKNSCQGIVVLPTGAGKTCLALSVIAKTGKPTLCLVPTRALLEQWHQEIRQRYCGPIGLLGDGSRTIETITVSTYESAYRRVVDIGNTFDMIVVDECHHFGCGIRDEILKMCTAGLRLGLTATPPSSYSSGDVANRLECLIGPIVFELSIEDLTGSYLADYDYYTLHIDLTPEEKAHYQIDIEVYRVVFNSFRTSCPMGNYLDWVRFASRSEEGRKALTAFHRVKKILASAKEKFQILNTLISRHWDQKLLIFTADTETTYHISKNYLIMPITSEIGRKEREAMIRSYREGRIRTLVSCRVLNEGIDVPDAEVAIIMGGNHGTREHIQRIGRILRPKPGKRAIIYELVCRGTIEVNQSKNRRRAFASPITSSL
ncbi:MAG: DEAD/DEAH box helicase [Deltaproteobacteria bacterium]|nr:DEAD/DEAH box helicase [Deltaproteobacteria bacterium]